jgi:CheY-like chemotaxis protein
MYRETVLLIEDDLDARDANTAVLEHLGYRVLTAATGEEALEQWRNHEAEIQVVLSDLVTPGSRGEAAFSLLRVHGARVPIVVLSGYAVPMGRRFTEADGVVAWLQKPIGIDELDAALRRALDRGTA